MLYSVELNEYIEHLDKRLEEKTQKEYVGIVAKKSRKCGTPSTSKAPMDAPSWAVKRSSEGMLL